MRRSDVETAVCHVRRRSDGVICVVDAGSIDPLVYDRVDAPAPADAPETDVERLQRDARAGPGTRRGQAGGRDSCEEGTAW